MRQCFGWVAAVSLAFAAQAQPVEYDIQISGGKVGSVTWEEKPDGSFTSKSNLKVANIDATSEFTGKIEKDQVVSFVMHEKATGVEGTITFAAGKVTVNSNGKEVLKDKPLDIKDQAPFSNLQMPLLRMAFRYVTTVKPGATQVPLFNLNALSTLQVGVKSLTQKNAMIGGQQRAFSVLVLDLGGMAMELYGDAKELLGVNIPAQQFRVVRKGAEAIFKDPLARFPELSKPEFEVVTERGLKMKTRDGAELVADVVRPKPEGKYPVILVRTPYGRGASALEGGFYAQRGYAYVVQDVRGMGDSTGEWDPFINEVADGKDTLDWLVSQPWCDGSVGMIGGSYLGLVQWAAAVNHHPALKCIIPQVSPPEPMLNIPWDHGAFMLQGNLWWSRIVKSKTADMAGAMAPLKNLRALETLPLTQADDKFLGTDVPFFDKWLNRPFPKDWPGAYTTAQVAQVKIPVMHVSGIWDGDGIGTLTHWNALRESGGNQWLIFGPWEHGFNLKTQFGDVVYGRGSVLELQSVYLRFFDTYLKGRKVDMESQPRVRMFVTGANRWIQTSDWPMPGSNATTWYLAGGKANGIKSQGTLAPAPEAKAPDRYLYNPNRSYGMPKEMELDPSQASTKLPPAGINDEVLLYKSQQFDKPTRIAGPMTCELSISTTVRDATFHVFVIEETELGEMRILGLPGTRRATYQDDGSRTLLTPGEVYKVKIQPWLFAHEFAKGSRMVLMVFSDRFPSFARNPGTGEPDATATKLLKATHTVYKDAARPSRFTFQMLP